MKTEPNFKDTIQVYMPRPPYNSRRRQWVDYGELKLRLSGAYPIKVDPDFPYVRDVAMRDIQDQPDGGIWTSSLMVTTPTRDGRYVTDWSIWCESNMPHWVSKGCALLSIKPDARIYTISSVEDYHRLRDMYPYPLFERHGRQERLGHSVDWEAVARDYDGVHHEKGMSNWVRSTLWLNPEYGLKYIKMSKVLKYGSKGLDVVGRPIHTYTISEIPKGLVAGTVDYNHNNYFRTSYPQYLRLYKSESRPNPQRIEDWERSYLSPIIADYYVNENMGTLALAQLYGTHQKDITEILLSQGVQLRPNRRPRKTVEREKLKDIVEDYSGDLQLTLRELESKYGIGRYSIRRYFKNWGVPTRRTGTREQYPYDNLRVAAEVSAWLQGGESKKDVAEAYTQGDIGRVDDLAELFQSYKSRITPKVYPTNSILVDPYGETLESLYSGDYIKVSETPSPPKKKTATPIKPKTYRVKIDLDALKDQAELGYTIQTLAEEFGVSAPTIRSRLEDMGMPVYTDLKGEEARVLRGLALREFEASKDERMLQTLSDTQRADELGSELRAKYLNSALISGKDLESVARQYDLPKSIVERQLFEELQDIISVLLATHYGDMETRIELDPDFERRKDEVLENYSQTQIQNVYRDFVKDTVQGWRSGELRKNPIPRTGGTAPIEFIDQDSPNENLDGEDLRNANLKGSNLSGSSFRNANLEGAVLYGCDLRNCDFTGANLDRASLAFASVEGAVFDECSMSNTLLFDPEDLFTVDAFNPSNVAIGGCIIDTSREPLNDNFATMRKSNDADLLNQYMELVQSLLGLDELFPYTEPQVFTHQPQSFWYKKDPRPIVLIVYTFDGLNLRSADLTHLGFTNADLRGADFQGATLYDGQFKFTNLRGVNLAETNLKDTWFREVDAKGADFRGANLKGTLFWKSEFPGANFQDASMQEANLSGANFCDADFRGADLRGSAFRDTYIYGADFRGAKLPDPHFFNGALYTDSTKFSLSLDHPRFDDYFDFMSYQFFEEDEEY